MLSMTWPPLVLEAWVTTRGVSLGTTLVSVTFYEQVLAARLEGQESPPRKPEQLGMRLSYESDRPTLSAVGSLVRLPALLQSSLVWPRQGCGRTVVCPEVQAEVMPKEKTLVMVPSPLDPSFLSTHPLSIGLSVLGTALLVRRLELMSVCPCRVPRLLPLRPLVVPRPTVMVKLLLSPTALVRSIPLLRLVLAGVR